MTSAYALAHKETGELLTVDWRTTGFDGETEWFFSNSEYDMVWNTRNYFSVTNMTKSNTWGDFERPDIPEHININDYKIVELTYR